VTLKKLAKIAKKCKKVSKNAKKCEKSAKKCEKVQSCSAQQLLSGLGKKKKFNKLPILTCALCALLFKCSL